MIIKQHLEAYLKVQGKKLYLKTIISDMGIYKKAAKYAERMSIQTKNDLLASYDIVIDMAINGEIEFKGDYDVNTTKNSQKKQDVCSAD